MILVWVIIFIVSLFILSKAADYFTDAAAKIGHLLKLPQFMTGVLIVSLGTATPELITSIFGVARGEAGILSGNITGTVIVNILIGLGLVVVLSRKTAKFNWDSVSNDMPFLIGAAILLGLTIIDGSFNFFEALIFLLTYAVYVVYALRIRKMNRKQIRDDLRKEISSQQKEDFKKFKDSKKVDSKYKLKILAVFCISLLALLLSAKFLIDALIQIAALVGLGTSVLAASFVAIGTSLPEISVAIASTRKGNFDLVIGNIMGASIYDILVIFGVVGLFTNIPIPREIITLALPMLGAAILIQWLVTLDRKITVTDGLMMTLLYITFIAKLFKIF